MLFMEYFRFNDPDEHLIEIGETLEIFVNNLSRKRYNEKKISEKPVYQLIQLIS